MRGRAVARARVVELAGICSCVGNKFRHAFRRHGSADEEHVVDVADVRDRREVFQRIVWQLAIERAGDRVARRREDQRLPIGRALRD